MTLAARRFPTNIIRIRQAPGDRNQWGEYVPGPTVETPLAANVQPLSLEDSDIAGGVMLVDRLRVFVPYALDVVYAPALMKWGITDVFKWGTDTFTFGRKAVHGQQAPALSAAFDNREADRVRVMSALYVVEESRVWSDYVRATLLRET